MKLLLDTHSFIFYVDRPDALPPTVRAALEEVSNDLFLSLVSPWEMQIMSTLGKLQLDRGLAVRLRHGALRPTLDLSSSHRPNFAAEISESIGEWKNLKNADLTPA